MFRKIIVFFISLFSCIISFAQGFGTVKGLVSDTSGKGIDAVVVTLYQDAKYTTTTNSNGEYSMKVPAGVQLTLVFSSNIKADTAGFMVEKGQTVFVNKSVKRLTVSLGAVEKIGKRNDKGVDDVKVKGQSALPSLGDFNANLAFQTLGTTMKSELSSAYSVRGGNFDENLVYVDDFEIYRPFLIRSGQQEGLSFVNGDMVDNVNFSSGGFQAKYGDKMSSVMDVSYRRPDSISGSVYGSLLGFGGHLEGCDKRHRFTFSVGVRQRLSQYILKSLDEKGEYSPNFLDVQAKLTYQVNELFRIEYLGCYARNKYTFIPVDRETTFGLLTDVKKLTIYFDGQEADQYQNLMNGLSLIFTPPKKDLYFKLLGAYYLNREKENYDILGEYYLSQVESDLSKSNFGDILYSLGIGGLHNWARDVFNSDVYYGGLRGGWYKKGHSLLWGADYKREVIYNKISEWNILDSAGYSLPYNFTTTNVTDSTTTYIKPDIGLQSVIKPGDYTLARNRISAFIQDTWKLGSDSTARFNFNYGVRFEWDDVSKEPLITPRVQFSYKPKGRADLVLTASGGTYYQPAYYREMLNLTDSVNLNLRAQKSAHAVLGLDYTFKAWKRNFNFTTEIYYKYLWDLVPYDFDDVLIRYYGANSARGYAAGIDMRLNGELAEGAESWVRLSVMQTAEDIIGDHYTAYYDSSHTQIGNTAANASKIVDSAVIHPGYVPRPTDQRVNFSMYFQDYIPQFPFIRLHLALVFGTGLPFGPPGSVQYRDKLRIPPYRRLDMGFSGQLWTPKWAKNKNKFNQGLKGVWASLEVFNILGISNTVSYLWISDVSGTRYAVPNYLTGRRVNFKVIVSF